MRTLSTTLLSLALSAGLIACDEPAPTDAGVADTGPADSGPPPVEDAGPPADTWTNFASDFMQRYCVDCHATSPKDFNLLAEVRANAPTIRCGVSDVMLADCGTWPPPQQFPIGTGPSPTDEERRRLVVWLDAGAPE